MGLLIDSTVFVTAERQQETARDVIGRILHEWVIWSWRSP
jgi:hypothetical protein